MSLSAEGKKMWYAYRMENYSFVKNIMNFAGKRTELEKIILIKVT